MSNAELAPINPESEPQDEAAVAELPSFLKTADTDDEQLEEYKMQKRAEANFATYKGYLQGGQGETFEMQDLEAQTVISHLELIEERTTGQEWALRFLKGESLEDIIAKDQPTDASKIARGISTVARQMGDNMRLYKTIAPESASKSMNT